MRALISNPADVARRWREQYFRDGKWQYDDGKRLIGERLAALGPTITREQAEQIVGNDTWTTFRCSECGERVPRAIEVGEECGYDTATAILCTPCVSVAWRFAQEVTP